jgi:hypothetical protein
MVMPTNRNEHAGTCSRLLHAQTLTVAFKKHWNLLAETTIAVQSTATGISTNSIWWSLLDEARTEFLENGFE